MSNEDVREPEAPKGSLGRQYHIKVAPGEVGGIVLMPGDPFRVQLIADRLEDPVEVAHAREYRTVVGTYKGLRVAGMSTGIGCPSAAIAVEELARCGVHTFIRVGSTAALQADVAVGDLVVNTGTYRNDGTSQAYAPLGYPAVPDTELTMVLTQVARETAQFHDVRTHVGINVSDDAFYAEGMDWLTRMSALGLLNVEMESSAIFTVARLRGLRAGMICGVSGNLVTGDAEYGGGRDPRLTTGWEHSIDIALEAAYRLELGA
ncbi:MAG: nucleoside phosphorylase [Nocardioidaceae bacterium]